MVCAVELSYSWILRTVTTSGARLDGQKITKGLD